MKTLKTLVFGSLLLILAASCSPDTADVSPENDNISEADTFSPYYDSRNGRRRHPDS